MTDFTIARRVDTCPDEIFIKTENGIYAFPRNIGPFQTKANIIPSDYAIVSNNEHMRCAISMNQQFNGFTFEQSNIRVLQEGLMMSTPQIFMAHYQNANLALENKSVLYDASGKAIEGERLNAYVNMLSFRCWVWLNARFVNGTGFLGLDLETVTSLDAEGRLVTKREPLEKCLNEGFWADIDSMNSQGFLTKRAKTPAYSPGKTINVGAPQQYYPVAFQATIRSNQPTAFLYQVNNSWPSTYSSVGLGVFPCAEGV